MKLTIIGTGYVGLVSGACFAEMGNQVYCVDIDQEKIEGLKEGRLPIYEPGLDALVANNHAEGRLHFTSNLQEAMEECQLYFIAVGTPPGEDGSADLQYVLAVAKEIGSLLTDYAVIVNKSTVPVGTADTVREALQQELDNRGLDLTFDVVSNPEFLKEGAAIDDFMKPDRIVVGTNSPRAREMMHQLYAPFNRNHERTIYMGVRDAEMTKYAANSMLATKISFINEMANLCELMGVDVESVRRGIGSDSRIGFSFIYPGCGYGGSCFPKDVQALIRMAQQVGFEPQVLQSVENRNQFQKGWFGRQIRRHFGDDLSGLTFGVWGLAFKPGTDDMREASAKVLLADLMAAGANVLAYDPVAMETAARELPAEWFASGRLRLVDNQYQALEGVDAMLLVTEWKPFRIPDLDAMRRTMKQRLIFDGRNQYDPALIRSAGFGYVGVGRLV
ncbi:UDP-glucose dehydrogenase family protein [Pelovirga terrestris]|uniref:UDP-glucose 6-dehydrogenase n=1 Tax=Pelovirga terrestris TaxID=2771352 RepID=A0A8J6QN86_9BACT|nr:UDP-glucose/GDP-mannose dehydrogenase family protein [Pelovirga terrestris]MBD1399311.1 UDP-glucose/GDP-mannose dehydrogenase family protein [Pelovirga terrestris]